MDIFSMLGKVHFLICNTYMQNYETTIFVVSFAIKLADNGGTIKHSISY